MRARLSTHLPAAALLAALAFVSLAPRPARAFEWDRLRLRGRLQPRYEVGEDGNGDWSNRFLLRRARVDGRWTPLDWLRLELEIDGSDGVDLKDAYARIEVHDLLRLTAGQFKKPFSRLKMTSPWDLLIPERGLLDAYAIRHTDHGGYGGRDLGLMASGVWKGPVKLRYYLGAFDGDGRLDGRDETHRDYVARLQAQAFKGLVLAVHANHKLYYLGEHTRTVNAFGADLRWTFRGFRLQLEGAFGDNPDAGPGHGLAGGHAIASYRWKIADGWVLTPAAMGEIFDPDDQQDGYAWRIAAAANLDIGKHVRVVLASEWCLGEAEAYDARLGAVQALDLPRRIYLQLDLAI